MNGETHAEEEQQRDGWWMREHQSHRRKLDTLRTPSVERHGQRRTERGGIVGEKAYKVVGEVLREAVGVDGEDGGMRRAREGRVRGRGCGGGGWCGRRSGRGKDDETMCGHVRVAADGHTYRVWRGAVGKECDGSLMDIEGAAEFPGEQSLIELRVTGRVGDVLVWVVKGLC